MYWQVDVKLEYEKDNGGTQKITEKYLVEGVSPTDVEVIINKQLEGEQFRISKVVQSKIIKIY